MVRRSSYTPGHKWRLIDDQAWRRAYMVLEPVAKDSFVPKTG
jgi:hypothetical protein